MKKLLLVLVIIFNVLCTIAQPTRFSGIKPNSSSFIGICLTKTTNLVFPDAVCHVDRGTKEVLVEPVKEAPNILLVKAAQPHFTPTNLSIVTSDGRLYNIGVGYDSLPRQLVYHFSDTMAENAAEVYTNFQKGSIPPALVKTYANNIVNNKRFMHGVRSKRAKMLAFLKGIYYKEDVLFFLLAFVNASPVAYDIDYIRTYIKDKKSAKRTATQEKELYPLRMGGDTTRIKANSTNTLVIALPKFMIPHAQFFAIEITEKQGGWQLLLKVPNKKLLKAKPLADLQ